MAALRTALIRARLWEADIQVGAEAVPSLGRVLADQIADVDAAEAGARRGKANGVLPWEKPRREHAPKTEPFGYGAGRFCMKNSKARRRNDALPASLSAPICALQEGDVVVPSFEEDEKC